MSVSTAFADDTEYKDMVNDNTPLYVIDNHAAIVGVPDTVSFGMT